MFGMYGSRFVRARANPRITLVSLRKASITNEVVRQALGMKLTMHETLQAHV